MRIQPISYRGRTVAVAVDGRFLLCPELESRPPGDPELTFVVFMCAYALDVAHQILPGPYRDHDARAYARACLIPVSCSSGPKSTWGARPRRCTCRLMSCALRGSSGRAGARRRHR